MNRRGLWLLPASLTVLLVAGAFGFEYLSTFQGTVSSYDFGNFGGNVPGTVEIQSFSLKPGDVIPWHYHKGLSYVILIRGTLSEQELKEDGTCGPITKDVSGSAFVEPPGRVHTVTNTGRHTAFIYWATVYPKGDPDGDAVFVDPPTCQ